MSEGEDILYEVKGKTAVITLNLGKRLNALNGPQYQLLAELVQRADEEEDTVLTLVQSTGRFFSAGANISDLGDAEASEVFSYPYWLKNFTGRNVWITDVFMNHKKVLACALNGPVIGLSAALVCLCDLIYVNDEEKFYFLAPFSNLGLVAEGGASATMFMRLGWAKASEALLFSRPIPGTILEKGGFFNKSYKDQNLSVEAFNEQVRKDLEGQFENLYYPSIFDNKQLLKVNRDAQINAASSTESVIGLRRWVAGVPQERFMKLAQKDIKHKM